MSLIVCSNEPEEDIVGQDSSIFKPYSFRNALSSTMKIPKNAQVALHSAKINLDGSIVIGDEAKLFYVYFGQGVKGDYTNASLRLDSQEDGVNLPIRVSLYRNRTGNIRVNPMELAGELTNALNRYIYHPQLVNQVNVSITQDADGKFTGYNFLLGAGLTSNRGAPNYELNNLVPPTESALENVFWSRRYGNTPTGWSYTNGSDTGAGPGRFRVSIARPSTQCAIYNIPPIATKSGIYRVTIDDMYLGGGADNQQCSGLMGLSRPSVQRDGNNRRRINPPYYNYNNGSGYSRLWQFYCDFWIYVAARDEGPYRIGDIVCGHCVVDTGDLVAGQRDNVRNNLRPKWEPVEYWNHSGSFQNGRGGAFNVIGNLLPDGYGAYAFEMRVDGEVVEYFVKSKGAAGDGSNGTYYPLLPYLSTESASHQLKPISQDCWSLYPVTAINNTNSLDKDRSLIIEEYTGAASNYDRNPGTTYGQGWLDPSDAAYGLYQYDGETAGGWLHPDRAGGYYSWEQECVSEGNIDDILEVMGRKPINKGSLSGGGSALAQDYEYDNLTGATPDLRYDYLIPVFILSESDRYTSTAEAGLWKRLLGFESTPVVDFFDDVNVVDFQVASSSIPRLISSKSIFVRLDNFTQESMNAFNKNTSKIISHLPRFDGTNVSGPLYLEPKNMIYLDLNNSEEIPANSFDISLCYSDETYADSLVGTTIIVLHVKEKAITIK